MDRSSHGEHGSPGRSLPDRDCAIRGSAHRPARDPLTYVRPVQDRHTGYLLVFTTGDAGWLGTSGVIFEHLAEAGYTIAGFSAPEIIKRIKKPGGGATTARAAKALDEMCAHVSRWLEDANGHAPGAAERGVGASN